MTGASTIVTMTIRVPRERFFYWLLSVDLSKIMHRYAILPGVVTTRNQTGPMHEVGASRQIVFTDGSTAVEEIIASDPPRMLDYRVVQLTSPFRHLVREGRPQIIYREVSEGVTEMEWRYTFYGHNWAATLLLKPLVWTFWRGFLRSTLVRAKALAEAEAQSAS